MLRLVQESYFDDAGAPGDVISYAYDAAGNRTQRSDASGLSTYTYGDGFRLAGVSGPSPEGYTYDQDGRLASMTRDGATRTLSFDADDRLAAVSDNGSPLASYTHDGERRRVSADSGQRRFVVAPATGDGLESTHLVTDGTGAVAAAYVWAGQHALMRLGPGGRSYYLTDAMGSVIALADDVGTVTADFRYDGFGNLRSAVGPAAQAPAGAGGDLRFQGGWLEESTGFYHFRARDYDPRTGLFLSRDPAEPILLRPETLHPYRFADANPHLYTDPTGEFTLVTMNTSFSSLTQQSLVKAALARQIRRMAIDAVQEVASNLFWNFLEGLAADLIGIGPLFDGAEAFANSPGGPSGGHGSVFETEVMEI
ncbi:MAG: RHS repeat-associated core domain-containing protein, partial [Acidobacteriota bacterium]